MMKMKYKIADYNIEIDSEIDLPDSINAASFYTEEEETDYLVTFQQIDSFLQLIGDYHVLSQEYNSSILVSGGKTYWNFTRDGASFAMTLWEDQQATCYYEYDYIMQRFMSENRKPLTFCCLEKIMLKYGRMILHSAHINYRGDSIVITAPSGTGKSTHASLWEKYLGAQVINGDRSIIGRKRDAVGKYHAYGLPMCGSSGIFENADGPLKAIVVIRQSKENYVEKPTALEAFRYLLSETTQNSWDSLYMMELMSLIENLIDSVPVYLLHCNMEKEAAMTLHEVIYGKKEI